jgi:hypothetical protein
MSALMLPGGFDKPLLPDLITVFIVFVIAMRGHGATVIQYVINFFNSVLASTAAFMSALLLRGLRRRQRLCISRPRHRRKRTLLQYRKFGCIAHYHEYGVSDTCKSAMRVHCLVHCLEYHIKETGNHLQAQLLDWPR